MMQPCARDCQNRDQSCHASCEAYLEYRDWTLEQGRKRLLSSEIRGYKYVQSSKAIKSELKKLSKGA